MSRLTTMFSIYFFMNFYLLSSLLVTFQIFYLFFDIPTIHRSNDFLFLRKIIAHYRLQFWPMTLPGFIPRHLPFIPSVNACFAKPAFPEGLLPICYFFVKRKNTLFYFFDICYLFVKNKKFDFLFLREINAMVPKIFI